MLSAVGHALALAGSMAWEILWALILGFLLSAVVQIAVPKRTVIRLLGDDRPGTLATAAALGAASSSCSYAAVALARSFFRKGAHFTAAMAFEIGSTNLVVELGVIMAVLLGWQFTVAEYIGGPIMITLLAMLLRSVVRGRLSQDARRQASKGLAGAMEGHAAMDMSVTGSGGVWRRVCSRQGVTAVAHVFVMEWAAILRDVVVGLVLAGAIGAWVPDSFWRTFFFAGHPVFSAVWGPLIGPIVSILSFVCSIGNVPLAAVLWNGGISFGGVIAFIYADLLILPILNIYRKYYGRRMMLVLLGTFYAAMAGAGYIVEALFGVTGLTPSQHHATVSAVGPSWNYTTWLNIVFLALAAALVAEFVRSGGIGMLRMMGGAPDDGIHHAHSAGKHDDQE
jgi:uncharacterized membrane protein YraQ (UPF0718 family)